MSRVAIPCAAQDDRAARLLADRIRGSVPPRHPAFGKLLRLVAIEVSRDVPTAAVTMGARSRMLVNPDFVAARCRTDAHLSMLVLHELYHVMLGHTRMYRRATLHSNWAFDCIINAQLCRLYPSLEFTSFFSAGAAGEGPWSLLAPPPGWPEQPSYADGRIGDMHRRLYDDDGATTAELFALLDAEALRLAPAGEDGLLGNHAAEPEDGDDPLLADPELSAEIRRIVARWPMVERRGGADDGGALEKQRVALQRSGAARRALTALLRSTAGGADGRPRPLMRESPGATVWPGASDRRAMVLRQCGFAPLLWQGGVRHHGIDRDGQVTVYLDVSGSMGAWTPILLDALAACREIVKFPVLGFSTQVHAIRSTELAAGRFASTGGTHIACVADHMLRNHVRRAVVITDGDVQEIPTAAVEQLQKRRPSVTVGLLDGADARFAELIGWRVRHLPALR